MKMFHSTGWQVAMVKRLKFRAILKPNFFLRVFGKNPAAFLGSSSNLLQKD